MLLVVLLEAHFEKLCPIILKLHVYLREITHYGRRIYKRNTPIFAIKISCLFISPCQEEIIIATRKRMFAYVMQIRCMLF